VPPDRSHLLRQLEERDYIEPVPGGYRFQVPLLAEWWRRQRQG